MDGRRKSVVDPWKSCHWKLIYSVSCTKWCLKTLAFMVAQWLRVPKWPLIALLVNNSHGKDPEVGVRDRRSLHFSLIHKNGAVLPVFVIRLHIARFSLAYKTVYDVMFWGFFKKTNEKTNNGFVCEDTCHSRLYFLTLLTWMALIVQNSHKSLSLLSPQWTESIPHIVYEVAGLGRTFLPIKWQQWLSG